MRAACRVVFTVVVRLKPVGRHPDLPMRIGPPISMIHRQKATAWMLSQFPCGRSRHGRCRVDLLFNASWQININRLTTSFVQAAAGRPSSPHIRPCPCLSHRLCPFLNGWLSSLPRVDRGCWTVAAESVSSGWRGALAAPGRCVCSAYNCSLQSVDKPRRCRGEGPPGPIIRPLLSLLHGLFACWLLWDETTTSQQRCSEVQPGSAPPSHPPHPAL